MGTPEFAVPSLEALASAGHEILLAVTQPDRPVGRRAALTPPPVKLAAQALDIPVFQHERIRRREPREFLAAFSPDLFVTAAFGQILSPRLLAIPRLGTVNVHASLLPKYRGPAPINWAIVNGEKTSGITTMFSDEGIDTGKTLLRAETSIGQDENAVELTRRLAQLGAGLLVQTLEKLEGGCLAPQAQNEEEMSYFPMLKREDGALDFSTSCEMVYNRVRGLNPWPGTFASTAYGQMKIYAAKKRPELSGEKGKVLRAFPKEGLIIACGSGAIEITEMQLPGGKRLQAAEFLRGRPILAGEVFIKA
jgi:methionyl-tRNA formyltransferase